SAVSRSAFGALALLLPWPCTVLGQVTTAQYDNARTGAYTTETQLTPRTVNTVTFGKIHVITVDGDVYAQVLYLPSVNIPSKGTHAVRSGGRTTPRRTGTDRKSTRLNSSHEWISYAVF